MSGSVLRCLGASAACLALLGSAAPAQADFQTTVLSRPGADISFAGPAIAARGNGGAIAAWEERDPVVGDNVLARVRRPVRGWQKPVVLGTTPYSFRSLDAAGNAAASTRRSHGRDRTALRCASGRAAGHGVRSS
jgi:hypothetical protein